VRACSTQWVLRRCRLGTRWRRSHCQFCFPVANGAVEAAAVVVVPVAVCCYLIAACVRPRCPGSCCVRWSAASPTRSRHPFCPTQPRNDWNLPRWRKTRATQARHERRRAWRKTGQGGVAQARTSTSQVSGKRTVACAIVTAVPCEATRTPTAQRASPTPVPRPCRACCVVPAFPALPSVVGRCCGRPTAVRLPAFPSTAGKATGRHCASDNIRKKDTQRPGTEKRNKNTHVGAKGGVSGGHTGSYRPDHLLRAHCLCHRLKLRPSRTGLSISLLLCSCAVLHPVPGALAIPVSRPPQHPLLDHPGTRVLCSLLSAHSPRSSASGHVGSVQPADLQP
jgi:hypothetical protein